jgi:hypothetical protein
MTWELAKRCGNLNTVDPELGIREFLTFQMITKDKNWDKIIKGKTEEIVKT